VIANSFSRSLQNMMQATGLESIVIPKVIIILCFLIPTFAKLASGVLVQCPFFGQKGHCLREIDSKLIQSNKGV
jgi:hypothetical protein